MTVTSWLGFAIGLIIVLATGMSVITALMLPRRGRAKLQRAVSGVVRCVFNVIGHRSGDYDTRDRILALQAPMFLVGLLATWLVLFLVGFALILWPLMPQGGFLHALTVSGSSLFTLGFATEPGVAPRSVIVIAAATGLVVVALQIAYLPVLYGAFNRRETLVTLLESRGGVPSWGPEILARHELVDNVQNLAQLYARWEEWAADVAESHATYPVLLYFRSPHPQRSWVVGLLAVLDAAALHLALCPLTAPAEARPFMRMGYMALRELSRTINLPVNDDPLPDDPVVLTRESFDDALHHMEHAGWTFERGADESWVHFRGWRVTYEALAYGLANAVNAPPALWAGPRDRLPDAFLAPERPPHREPSREVVKVRELTRQRRAVRDGAAVPLRGSPQHQHDPTEETWGPRT